MSAVDFDVIVVGAGVVGLAIARACALRSRAVLVLESERSIGTQISSRSSEVIHAGLYYPTGSLKARLCVAGNAAMQEYCRTRSIGYLRCGKLVVATRKEQRAALEHLKRQAELNGVQGCRVISAAEARELEPEVECMSALLSPSSGIVDSHALINTLAADLEAADGIIVLGTRFVAARQRGGRMHVDTLADGEAFRVRSRWLVNAAGLGATAVARAIEELPPAAVPPMFLAKGNYFRTSLRPFRRLVYPLPEPGGLGIHATPDLSGSIRFGPDVQWVAAPDYRVDVSRKDAFESAIRAYWPRLPSTTLAPDYAGIRPKIAGPGDPAADFCISQVGNHGIPGVINLFGIESPGLTAALPLGDLIAATID